MSKLDKVRKDAIDFNTNVFGNIFSKKRTLEARISIQCDLEIYPSHSGHLLEKSAKRLRSCFAAGDVMVPKLP
jgi:hypothetical protein